METKQTDVQLDRMHGGVADPRPDRIREEIHRTLLVGMLQGRQPASTGLSLWDGFRLHTSCSLLKL